MGYKRLISPEFRICTKKYEITSGMEVECFISRGRILAVEPSHVPVLCVARRLCVREKAVPPPLNGDATKFQAWPVGALVLTVQVEKLSEEQQAGLFSKVNFAEHLEVAYIGHRIGSYVLWAQIKEIQHISKEL